MAYCLGYHEERSRLQHRRTLTAAQNGELSETLTSASIRKSKKVKAMIHQTLPHLLVEEVFEIKNSFLEKMYELKKEEYNVRYRTVNELLLFHATSAANVQSIRKDNFDWRKVSRGKFGLGNSFSDSAEYANNQANRAIGNKRAFIVAKVLVANKVGGKQNMKVPPANYDTTTGNNTVYVKFSDNEVLPQYVVFYNYKDSHKKSNGRKYEDNNLFDSDSFYNDNDQYYDFFSDYDDGNNFYDSNHGFDDYGNDFDDYGNDFYDYTNDYYDGYF